MDTQQQQTLDAQIAQLSFLQGTEIMPVSLTQEDSPSQSTQWADQDPYDNDLGELYSNVQSQTVTLTKSPSVDESPFFAEYPQDAQEMEQDQDMIYTPEGRTGKFKVASLAKAIKPQPKNGCLVRTKTKT